MSQQAFATFYEDFLTRPENADLASSFSAVDSAESFAAKAVEVGSTHGFSFTIEDVDAVMAASIKKQLENVELSDQQLEAVAGGAFSRKVSATSLTSLVTINLGNLPIDPVGDELGKKLSAWGASTVMCNW